MYHKELELAVTAARAAGELILEHFKKDVASVLKTDGSPVTIADKIASDEICRVLKDSPFPVVSEEKEGLFLDAKTYWIVDPLDGTKEFISGIPEFTVNIGLVVSNKPVVGVVYAPALNELYAGLSGGGVALYKSGTRSADVRKAKSDALVLATSRFHEHPATVDFAGLNRAGKIVPLGSALKYVRMAFGSVDAYLRVVGTSEWDTAAAQAILEASGGQFIDMTSQKPLLYGKNNRRNGMFFACRHPYLISDFLFPKNLHT